jgi:hypothetical protein
LPHVAEHAHAQPRTGKRMAVHEIVGQAQLHAEVSDLVLEELA